MATDPKDLPSTPHPDYLASAADVLLMRDLLAGTRRIHDQRTLYLPKYKKEKPEEYKRRAMAAKVFGGLARTLSASVGMLFAKPPVRSDGWSATFEDHWQNIDLMGTLGDVFIKRIADDALADGYTGVLVDGPPPMQDKVIHAGNEAALNRRPKWASYRRADIISWRHAVIDNATTLTQVVLRETILEPVGEFGAAPQVQYRVCYLAPGETSAAAWKVLQEIDDGMGGRRVVQVATGLFLDFKGNPLERIPFSVCYGGRVDGPFCAPPPLLDVAWANLEHWRTATALEYYSGLAAFPQPTIEGELAKDENGITPSLALGPGVLVRVTVGSKFSWTEISGRSLAELRAQLADRKDEIGELGASFLVRRTRGVETAEAKRMDATAENANLSTAAQGIQDGIDEALRIHALYLGVPAADAPTITINTDFEGTQLDAPTMTAYVGAVANAGLPVRILLEAWQAGGRIDPDEDLDKLEADMTAAAQAAEDLQKLQAEAKAKAAENPPIPPVPAPQGQAA